MDPTIQEEHTDTDQVLPGDEPARAPREPAVVTARPGKLEVKLAEYRDALTGMAAKLREYEKRGRRHEAEKAEIVARIAALEQRNAVLESQREHADAATRQANEQLTAAIQALQTQASEHERVRIALQTEIDKADKAFEIMRREAELTAAARHSELQRELAAEREISAALRNQLETSEQAIALVKAGLESRQQAPDPAAAAAPVEPAGLVAPVAGGDGAPEQLAAVPVLESLDGEKPVSHALSRSVMVIGRSKDTDIRVTGPNTSRRHARVYVKKGSVIVEDMGSLNGTYVNEQVVRRRELHDGDVLDVGGARLRFVKRS